MEKSHGGSGAAKYDQVELKDGRRVAMADAADDTWVLANGARLFRKDTLTSQRPLGSLPVSFKGRIFTPEPNYWKTGPEGFERQIDTNLLVPEGSRLAYVRFLDDFPRSRTCGRTSAASKAGAI